MLVTLKGACIQEQRFWVLDKSTGLAIAYTPSMRPFDPRYVVKHGVHLTLDRTEPVDDYAYYVVTPTPKPRSLKSFIDSFQLDKSWKEQYTTWRIEQLLYDWLQAGDDVKSADLLIAWHDQQQLQPGS